MSPESSAATVDLRPLVAVLEQQVHAQDALLAALRAQAEAIRTADAAALATAAGQEQRVLQHIRGLESQRISILQQFGVRSEITISAIAGVVPGAVAAQLQEIRTALRDRVEQARRLAGIVRTAAEALSGHMTGVMQHMAVVVNGATTYGSGGQVEVCGNGGQTGIDIKS